MPSDELRVGSTLRLLGDGTSGSILMALGKRPLRTKQLIERLPRYAPRTIYRHAERLRELGLVERREVPGVPPIVIHRLTDPPGRTLFRLIAGFADATLVGSPRGGLDDNFWKTLSLLGEMWERELIHELSRSPRSPTELAELSSGLSFHQVNRRLHLFRASGLLQAERERKSARRYVLTPEARRGMALVAGLARWRQRCTNNAEVTALSPGETLTVLRVILPLVALPGWGGAIIGLQVGGSDEQPETAYARVARNGALRCQSDDPEVPDSWVRGTVNIWLAAILDGNRGRLKVGGRMELLDSCLKRLHESLRQGGDPGSASAPGDGLDRRGRVHPRDKMAIQP